MNKDERKRRFRWRSRTQYIMFFISYLLDWEFFNFIIYETPSLNPTDEPTLVHFLVVIIILGSPVLYFQSCVGEYSNRGCLALGEMLPAAYGLGYAMLLISFVRITIGLFYLTKILSYLLDSFFDRTGPWLLCLNIIIPESRKCFGKADIDLCPTREQTDEPCFDHKTRVFSAFIYKEYVAFMRLGSFLTPSQERYKLIVHSFHSSILLPLVLIFVLKGIKSFAVSLRGSMIFSVGATMSILVVVVTRPGGTTGFLTMYSQFSSKPFLNLHTWTAALRRVIYGLRLTEGGHFLFGSYIPAQNASGFRRSFYLSVSFFSMLLFIQMYFNIFVGLLNYKLYTRTSDLELSREEDSVFVLYPLVLGAQPSAYIFTIIYFLVIFLLTFHALILNILVIEKTIAVQFDIREYSTYIRILIVVSAFMLTYALEIAPFYRITETAENEFKRFQTCVLALQIIVLFVYGLQRMGDDVYFFTNSQVGTFTKFCWMASLILSAGSFYVEITESPHVNFKVGMIVWGVLCLPIVVLFVLKVADYVIKKNIIGLLRPCDSYGPPDLERRIQRILYNPRLSTRCRGRQEVCYHNCLLNSSAVQKAVQEEINLVNTFITELQVKATETLQIDVISALNIYKKILLKGLAKKESN